MVVSSYDLYINGRDVEGKMCGTRGMFPRLVSFTLLKTDVQLVQFVAFLLPPDCVHQSATLIVVTDVTYDTEEVVILRYDVHGNLARVP